MPQGKLAAQVAHASLKAVLDKGHIHEATNSFTVHVSKATQKWMNGEYTKVVVYVESEKELSYIYERAYQAGLPCSIIRDIGKTVFNGVPTRTAVAVGPSYSGEIDEITGKLPVV